MLASNTVCYFTAGKIQIRTISGYFCPLAYVPPPHSWVLEDANDHNIGMMLMRSKGRNMTDEYEKRRKVEGKKEVIMLTVTGNENVAYNDETPLPASGIGH